MKFQHDFKLLSENTNSAGNSFSFKEADNNIQLDFFKHIMRVALFKDGARLMPTFSVCPGDCKMPQNGRARLSDEGFEKENCKTDCSSESQITFKTEDAKISIELHNFRMKVESSDGKMLYQDRDYIAYNFDHELGRGSMHFISREAD